MEELKLPDALYSYRLFCTRSVLSVLSPYATLDALTDWIDQVEGDGAKWIRFLEPRSNGSILGCAVRPEAINAIDPLNDGVPIQPNLAERRAEDIARRNVVPPEQGGPVTIGQTAKPRKV